MEVYYTRCLTEGHPCLVVFDYESENNVVSQRLVEKLQLPTTFHLNQAWIKFSTRQCVKEVLCDIAPMDSCHLLLGWAWLCFKTLHLGCQEMVSMVCNNWKVTNMKLNLILEQEN